MIDVDPRVDPRWLALQPEGGSLFTTPAWIGAVSAAYDLVPSARLLMDGAGDAVAGVGFCELDDLRGRRLVSFPFSDYHEPLGRRPADVAEVLRSLADGAVSGRFRIPDHRVPEDAAAMGFTERRDLLRHRVVVDGLEDADAAFASLHTKVRQNIRRSRRAGVRIELRSDPAALREFYEMHVAVRTRKYRLLPQPFSFLEAIHDAFAPSGALTVAIARHDDRPIAGIVFIEVGDTLYYKFNASVAEHLDVRPNEQLLLAGVELCIRRGLSGIDLGVSDVDQDGLVRYKRKFAHVEQDVVTLVAGPATTDAGPGAGVTELLVQLTELFTDPAVPAEVAERAGRLLYRYFA